MAAKKKTQRKRPSRAKSRKTERTVTVKTTTLGGARGGLQLTLQPAGDRCDRIMVGSRHVKGGIPIGKVCERNGRWSYSYVGGGGISQTMYPALSKRDAIKKAVAAHAGHVAGSYSGYRAYRRGV